MLFQDGYLVLHLKKACPRPVVYSDSNTESSDCSPKKKSVLQNHAKSRRFNKLHISSNSAENLVTYGRVNDESPYVERLRLTPERLNRALEKVNWSRGKFIFCHIQCICLLYACIS